VYSALPLGGGFLGLQLSQPNIVLALLVGAAMWVQQKMSMNTTSADPRQASQTQMMLWMMPMMFALISLSVPAGLGLYWVANSVARVALQYRVTGWGGLKRQPPQAKTGPKYLKFDTPGETTTAPDTSADIVVKDTQDTDAPAKPSKSRYQPGRERQQRRRKSK
jgi:hypothetical protein